jgi:diguanylate cyclase (GGDEF)-like protein
MSSEVLPSPRAADIYGIDLATLIAPSAGISLLIDETGSLFAYTPSAEMLANDKQARTQMSQLALNVQISGTSARCDIETANQPPRRFDVCAQPIQNAQGAKLIWLMATETSIKDHLIDALKTSRAMFRDLAEAAGEIGFTLDAKGNFSYVRAPGALGYAAWELNGLPITTCWGDGAAALCSQSRMPPHDVWVMDRHKNPVCLSAVTVPVFEAGQFVGVRGIARDVTQDRLSSLALAAAERRETLFLLILAAGREEMESSQLRERALDALLQGMVADGVRLISNGLELTLGLQDAAQIVLSAPCRAGTRELGYIYVSRSDGWDLDAPALLARAAEALSLVLLQADYLESLERASLTDHLTGLANRRAFQTEVERRLALRSRGATQKGALMLIDMDHFKTLNDTCGHDAGDAALMALASVLAHICRQTDIPARLGGDEFALWLDGSDQVGAERIAEQLRDIFAQTGQKVDPKAPKVTLSIGIAPLGGETISYTSLVKQADIALYQVKNQGRDGYAVWGEELKR